MNSCDIFVLPSISESFGIVQLEAMACGKPVVATRNGGSEEIIVDDGLGMLVEPANEGSLAKAITEAIYKDWNKEFIMSYAERFTWKNIAQEITKLYREVLSNGNYGFRTYKEKSL